MADPGFPRLGNQSQRWVANLLFGIIFTVNCIKTKEIRLGGHSSIAKSQVVYKQVFHLCLPIMCTGKLWRIRMLHRCIRMLHRCIRMLHWCIWMLHQCIWMLHRCICRLLPHNQLGYLKGSLLPRFLWLKSVPSQEYITLSSLLVTEMGSSMAERVIHYREYCHTVSEHFALHCVRNLVKNWIFTIYKSRESFLQYFFSLLLYAIYYLHNICSENIFDNRVQSHLQLSQLFRLCELIVE